MADRLYTIPITCCLDGQAHEVTDENVAVGNHSGEYQALCGHRVSASPMVAPVGQPCRRCTAVSAAAHPVTAPARRRLGWLRRVLLLGRPGT
ncbi:MAG: hypothetical protein ACRDS0_00645 [Pseudonocardiaceae bacterium]